MLPNPDHPARREKNFSRFVCRLATAFVVVMMVGSAAWGQYTGTGTFTKITSVAELTDGYYVITNETDEYLMTSGRSGSATTGYFTRANSGASEGEIANPTAANVWKIETNGSGQKTIYNEVIERYVGYRSGNSASIETSVENRARWTFSYVAGEWQARNVDNTSRYLSYNNSAPRFAAYGNTDQHQLQLYKLADAPTDPTLSTSPTAVPNLTYMEGNGPSAAESFTLSGTNLDPANGDITVTAPADFEVSTDEGGTFTNSINIPYTGGSLASTDIYVRLAAGLSEGPYSGDITISGGGAPNATVNVDGIVTPLVAFCGLENFNNSNLTNNYSDGYFVGNDGITWTYGHSRNEGNGGDYYPINGSGIMLRNASESYLEVTLPDGVETFSFDYRKAYTGSSPRQLEVIVNGIQIATTLVFGNSPDADATIHHFSHDINEPGPVTIRIKNVGSTSTNRQTVLDNISWTCVSECSTEPMEDQATFHVNSPFFLESTSAQLRWSNGDGDRRMVVVREGSAVNATPSDGTTYMANSIFGEGDEIGSGNFVVYNGTGDQVDLSGLTPGTEYFVRIFEYTCPGDEVYLTTLEEDVFITPPMVPTNFSMVCKGETTIDLAWSAPAEGNYDGYILVVREGANDPHAVTQLDPESQTHNLNFASAPTYGAAPGSKVLYLGNGTSATVSGLISGNQYRFAVHAYTVGSSGHIYSTRTVTTQTIDPTEVDNLIADPSPTSIHLFWTINASCADQIIVVASDDGAVTGTPTGNYTANSSSFTDGANPTIDGDVVVYSAVGSNVNVTGLTTDTEYCFKVFVRKDGNWSVGKEVCEFARESTVLNPGDLAIVAVNTSIQNVYPDYTDELCFVAFKSIMPGTSLDFTDNGYERQFAGYWSTTEGVIRMTLSEEAEPIPAGTVICIHVPLDFNINDFIVYTCGTEDENWIISSLNGTYAFNINTSGDPIWIMQGGEWVNDGTHQGRYTGNILYGWTSVGWETEFFHNASNPTSKSALYPNTSCFNTNLNNLDAVKSKYTGTLHDAINRVEWLDRIGDISNWTGFTNNTNYFGAEPDFNGECVELEISSTAATAGLWKGHESGDWFDCRNWDNRMVPDLTTDVTLSNLSSQPDPTIDQAGAECADMEIENGAALTISGDGVLDIYGDVLINGSFNANTGTVAFRGEGHQYFGDPEGEGWYSILMDKLTIEKPSGKLFTFDKIVINSALELISGIIVFDDDSEAIMEMSGNININNTSNNSFVDGKVRKIASSGGEQTFTFPIGDTTETGHAWYQPVRIEAGGSSDLNGTYEAQYFAQAHPNAGDYYDGSPHSNRDIGKCDYWEVEKISGNDVILAFNYENEAEEYCNIVNDDASLDLARWNGLEWDDMPDDHNDPGWIKTGIENPTALYGEFALSSTNGDLNVLPIELLHFEAIKEGETVRTVWTTATETNNDYFTVERSADGADFRPIGTVKGAGHSVSRKEYQFQDLQPLTGVSYYRLRQTDYDGKYDFGPVRAVLMHGAASFGIDRLFSGNEGVLLFYRAESPHVVVEIFNTLGQRVYHQTHENRSGYAILNPTLERGVYLLRLSDPDGHTDSRKFFH